MFSFPPFPQRLPRCVSCIERHTVFYLRNNISPVTKHSPTCAKQRKENETYLLRGVRSLKRILYSTWEHNSWYIFFSVRSTFWASPQHLGFSTGTKEFYPVRGARAVFTDVSLARIWIIMKLTLFVPKLVVNTFNHKPAKQSRQKRGYKDFLKRWQV